MEQPELTKGEKIRKTMLERYGVDHFRKIGKTGGAAYHFKPRYFSANPEAARLAGAKGGRISKRTKKEDSDVD